MSKNKFKIDELMEQQKKVKKIKQESYKKVLEHCYSFMKIMSDHGKTDCIFEVPAIIVSCPSIDIEECVLYMAKKLDKKKLHYYFYPPNKLYISWNHLI